MPKTAVVLLSGGLDSSTLLFQLKSEGYDVLALSVDYGQRHVRELEAAAAIAKAAGVERITANLSDALRPVFARSKSSQVGREPSAVPHGHYAAESMKATVVPNRNMLLLSVAGAFAESIRTSETDEIIIAYAAHAGDHPIYADCRPEFVESCATTLALATDGRVRLYDPFQHITKTDIVKRGALLGVPFNLTWSCYEDGAVHCGECGTCQERQEAFQDAEVVDPTEYSVPA